MLSGLISEIHKGCRLTPDPLGGDIMNPQSLPDCAGTFGNRPDHVGIFDYAYPLNNPTTLVDPLGLDSYRLLFRVTQSGHVLSHTCLTFLLIPPIDL
ncbi:MAG: hypothetical protein ACREE4_24235 [Stellaceae bacterium]